jgi:hypothetical protein
MTTLVNLVQPNPNQRLISELKEMLAAAEAGEFNGLVGVKLRPDNGFQTFRVGDCSDLELGGALLFAQHDLCAQNPKRET